MKMNGKYGKNMVLGRAISWLENKNKWNIQKFFYSCKAEDSIESISKELNVEIDLIGKSMICESEIGANVCLLIPGGKKIDFEKVNFALSGKWKLCDKKRAEEISGYSIYGISPLCLKEKMRVVLDVSLAEKEKIYISGGEKGQIVEIKMEDFIEAIFLQSNILPAAAYISK